MTRTTIYVCPGCSKHSSTPCCPAPSRPRCTPQPQSTPTA